MSNVLRLAVCIGVMAFVYQLVPNNVLTAIGATLSAFILGNGFMWLLNNLMPRRIIDCKDKAVLITGCDSGFGYSLALRLDALGFKVYAGCLRADGPAAQDLKCKSSDRLHVLQLDVTQQDQVEAAYQFVTATLNVNKLWAVVNNAGIYSCTLFDWSPLDLFTRMIDVNSIGPVRVTKTFLPLLRESHGRVVIVASAAGRIVIPFMTAYAMSKFAVIALADGLRRELHKWSITTHTIEPSFYKTPLLGDHLYKEFKKYWDQCSPATRSAYGEDFYNKSLETFHTILETMRQPEHQIHQVVDDMVDAVAGTRPKLSYVPNIWTRLHLGLLRVLPTDWLDAEIERHSANLLPAAMRASS